MRRLLVPVICVLLAGLTGCGDDNNTPATPSGTQAGGNQPTGGPFTCPVTVAEVTAIVGRSLADKGSLVENTCTFSSDEDSTTSVTVSATTQVGAKEDYDKLRELAGANNPAGSVTDIDKGKMGYMVLRTAGSEAVVVADTGTYSMNLTALYMNDDQKKEALLKLIDAVLS